ncbi:MAG: type II secretion system protein GspM, partial [Pseudomonadota bacterium]
MRRWTDRLNARERLLLALAAPLLLLLAGYHFGWQPVAEARAGLQAEIMRYGQIAALAEGSGGRPTLRRSTAPLAERATRSAETAGLS